MGNKIYTIGREFGSGGREIGEKLAERLGIKLYDKELLQQAAKESGFCEEIFENHDEKPTSSFLYSLYFSTIGSNSECSFIITFHSFCLLITSGSLIFSVKSIYFFYTSSNF